MALFIMATKLGIEEIQPGPSLQEKEDKVMHAIKDAELNVEWLANYTVMGPYDYIDIFYAPDDKTAMKVKALVHGIGQVHAEIWNAMEWKHFKQDVLAELPSLNKRQAA